jgi:GDPmannose 4,6-dehydratase
MSKRVALITGIAGQDGSYLAELLLEKGYEVHGVVRRGAAEAPDRHLWRIRHLLSDIEIHAGTLESSASVYRILQSVGPAECYHLAAQSFVSYAFEDELSTFNTNINGTHHVLAALRDLHPRCRLFFAASSEMFGRPAEVPQTETTRFHPRSSYGISKITGFELTRNYRETHGMHASSGILYNHESPRRGQAFVTRKITSYAAKIKLGLERELPLGDLDARRDWGHSRDFVRAMWLMMQEPEPGDYIIATGVTHSVRELAEIAFSYVGLDYTRYVTVVPKLVRPAEVHVLQGDPTLAKQKLGWEPTVSFQDLVHEMVEADLKLYGGQAQ